MGPTEIDTHPTSQDISPPHYKYLVQFFNQQNQNVVDAPIPPNQQQQQQQQQEYTSAPSTASQRQLKSEALRLSTFQGWPLDYLSPRELSAAGFFYLGISDQTRCAFCCITISQWEPQDSPSVEHRRHAPNCPFVLQLPVGNIPLSTGARTERVPASPSVSAPSRPPFFLPSFVNSNGVDTCTRFQNESRPNALPERAMPSTLTLRPPPSEDGQGSSASSSLSAATSGDLTSLRVLTHHQARRPELTSLEARMNTFADWPPGLEQRPAQLAEAGFYYMKTGDHVKCFCCDGALRNWEPKDDPWVEHARWFSRCNYLVSVKGDDYIKDIKARFPQVAIGSSSTTEDIVEVKKEKPKELKAREVDEMKDPTIVVSSTAESPPSSSSSNKLRDALLCQICCDQQLSMVFLPCGHSMSCPSCATALTTCPLCRKRIEATVRAYFPFSS